MKKLVYLAVFFASHWGFSQVTTVPTEQEADNNIYNSAGIDVKPEFPGGMKEFYSYIAKNYLVPNVKNLQGRVIMSFVIEKDGSLTEIKVLKDIGHGTGAEGIRVLKASPKWTPATQNGRVVRCSYQLPIAIATK